MTPKQRLLEYLGFTSFIWGLYLIWLIPFQLYIINMPWDMFINWLTIGTLAEMFVAYPIGKAIVKYTPKITVWCVNR